MKKMVYQINVETPRGKFQIDGFGDDQFTITFDLQKALYRGVLSGTLSIYNLSEESRNIISKATDDMQNIANFKISIQVGYNDGRLFAFKGNIIEAFSLKEGTDIITEITIFVGGNTYANTLATINLSKSATMGDLYRELSNKMNIPLYANPADSLEAISKVGNTHTGLATDIADYIAGKTKQNVYIDNDKLIFLQEKQILPNTDIIKITSQNNIIGTPIKKNRVLNLKIAFEPSIILGYQSELQSDITTKYNGFYKVVGVVQSGTISSRVASTGTTSLELLPL